MMSQHSARLARILASGGQDFAFRVIDPGSPSRPMELDDVPGTLVLDRELVFAWQVGAHRRQLPIELVYDGHRSAQHEVFRLCELHPHGVWVARLSPNVESGTLVPFTPPRVAPLTATIPLYIPPDMVDRCAGWQLRPGQDALEKVQLWLGGRAVLIAGQRGLGALSEEDGRKVTLWLPSGDALETIAETRNGGIQLVLRDIVSAEDAKGAHCGPNLLVTVTQDAGLLCVDTPDQVVPAEQAVCFLPKRSPLLDTWMRYAQLEHELAEKRLAARVQRPLIYADAHQTKKNWRVTIQMGDEERQAWLGAEPETRNEIQIDQQVALVSSAGSEDDDHQGQLVLLKMRPEGGGVVSATLRPHRGFRSLPSKGRLRAVENIGSKVEQKRRREALAALQTGRAACPSLMNVLSTPEAAEIPIPAKLKPTKLDDSQRRALGKILGCKDLVAIQGPPGTGKTSVIVEALLHLGARKKKGASPRVLVSSVQNEAIDNVAEQLAREGILIHQIRRESQDEDEALRYALHREQSRTAVLQKLEASLVGKPVLQTLDTLRKQASELDHLRAIMADEKALLVLADQLGRFCSETDLPTPLREAGRKLCVELRAKAVAPEPAIPVISATNGPPETPEATRDWWAARKEQWPLATRAAVDEAALNVINNAEKAVLHPLRYETRKLRAFQDLTKILEQIELPAVEPQKPLAVDSQPDPVDTWLLRVSEELNLRAQALLDLPEVIARRFFDHVREDPASWREIQRRHSLTTTATCSMAAQARDPADDQYDMVIIDEAGRASPLELLVPMIQGRRIVLIGDHRQLPPMLEDEVISALSRDQVSQVDLSAVTLFGEIFENLQSACRERLSVQYRMHGDIGQLVSHLFYRPHGQVLKSYFSDERAVDRQPAYGVLGNAPLTFIDTEDKPGPSPYENRQERRTVLALLTAFADSPALTGLKEPLHIGVICAYAQQRNSLVDELDQQRAAQPHLWEHGRLLVDVKTIDAVQGRQYPVTIVCLVRRDGRPGFLAAPNRINVALSRAQRQLIILGSEQSLTSEAMKEHAKHMPELVKYCRARRWLRLWSEVVL